MQSLANANEQVKVAATSICGLNRAYKSLAWFWSDQDDLTLPIAGLSQGYDQLMIRGDHHVGQLFILKMTNELLLIVLIVHKSSCSVKK